MATRKTAESDRYQVTGEMTIYRASELKSELLDNLAQHSELEVDLSGVSEIDSAGLQLMIMAKREAVLQKKALSFTGHSPAVLEILDLFGLAGYFGDPVVITS